MKDLERLIESKAQEIQGVVQLLDAAIYEFKLILSALTETDAVPALDNMPEEYFVIEGVYSILKQTREFAKFDLISMSDVELSTAVRYVFELSLWFSFLTSAVGNGKRYFASVVLENKKHLKKDIDQFEYELLNLRAAEADFRKRVDLLCEASADTVPPFPGEPDFFKIRASCLATFAERFSILTVMVERSGFEATAEYIETVALPESRQLLASVEERIENLENAGVKIEQIRTKDLAEKAKMTPEYAWIFSHASRKIHAEPFSIQTNFSKLTSDERLIYINYLLFKVKEMLKVSFNVFRERSEFKTRLDESQV